jgi:hypothetical protein
VEQKPGQPRMLVADAPDAGSALRLSGFYSAVRGGVMNLRVNLDGGGGADKSGIFTIYQFDDVGDQVVGRVVSQAAREQERYKPGTQAARGGDVLHFDRMVVPFAIGSSQFHLQDATIRGPMLGASMRGYVDFSRDYLSLSGTYIPVAGLNAALSGIPLLGDLINGTHGEGFLGINYTVQGSMSNPVVGVNPVSVLTPGILRQIFEFDGRQANYPGQSQTAPR